jgi:hypothetical protein
MRAEDSASYLYGSGRSVGLGPSRTLEAAAGRDTSVKSSVLAR